jgi:hypothetical protein
MSDESTPREPWVGTAIGREPNGLFAKGNRLATGNPQARRAAELRKVLRDATTEEDVRGVWKALTGAAMGGDTVAMRLFLEHTVGKPVQALEISGTEGEPVKFNMAAFVGVIQTALVDHPEAQYKLAAALKGVKLDGPDGPG